GLVDVGEDHGAPLGGDASREAPPHRNANPLLDLLLDADRRARDELVRRRVEQQNRRRIRAENFADAAEELPEQLLEIEQRERRVGDKLHALELLSRAPLRL